MSDGGRWVSWPARRSAKSTTFRLFCFPPAGQGAWVYHQWQHHLPQFLEVVPVELPGRGSRLDEAGEDNLPQLTSRIVSEMMTLFAEKPFALFGHSMGALVAYEVEQALRKSGGPRPMGLFVSGFRAPHLPDVDTTRLGDLAFEPFWDAFTRRYGTCDELKESHVRQYVYPILQCDFRLLEGYMKSQVEGKVGCPLVVLGGREDDRVPEELLRGWGEYATSSYKFILFDGCGHRYIKDNPISLLKFLSTYFIEYYDAKGWKSK